MKLEDLPIDESGQITPELFEHLNDRFVLRLEDYRASDKFSIYPKSDRRDTSEDAKDGDDNDPEIIHVMPNFSHEETDVTKQDQAGPLSFEAEFRRFDEDVPKDDCIRTEVEKLLEALELRVAMQEAGFNRYSYGESPGYFSDTYKKPVDRYTVEVFERQLAEFTQVRSQVRERVRQTIEGMTNQ